MRVLVLADLSSYHTERWVRSYEAHGVEVLALGFEPPRQPRPNYLYISPAGPPPLGYLARWREVKRVVSSYGPDFINPHMAPGYGLLAVSVAGKRPVVLSLWGPDVLETPRKGPLHRWVLARVFRRCALLQTDARVMDWVLVEEFGCPRERLFWLPYGPKAEVYRVPWRKSPPPPWRIITHRKLERVYDPMTVLRAAEILARRGFSFSLTFASGGSMEAELKAKIREMGLADRVRVTGWLPEGELWRLLAEAHIWVSASLADSTPASLLEAMALGAVPVVSDITPNTEWVVAGVNGQVFRAKDPLSLAGAILQLAGSPRLDRMRQRARQLVEEIAWERLFPRFLAKVREVLAGRVAPWGEHRKHLPWAYL